MHSELLAACVPIYDPMEESDLSVLLAVACMDLNMLVDLDVIRKRPDYGEFAELVAKESTKCSEKWAGMSSPQISAAIAVLRGRASGSGAQACSAADVKAGIAAGATTTGTPHALSPTITSSATTAVSLLLSVCLAVLN